MTATAGPGFWATQNETTAIDRFLTRLTNAVVFADEGFASLARRHADPARFRLVDLPPSADAFDADPHGALRGRDVFLFTFDAFPAYHEAVSRAAAAGGGRYVDWRYDVFPSFVGFNDSWRDPATPAPPLAYVVTSTARSGSTFLSDLLLRNGFGNPKEHIRAPFIEPRNYRNGYCYIFEGIGF